MDANSTQDTVTFEQFYKIVRPSFHRDFDEEDLVGVFKRSTFIVFTDVGMYVRVPGTDRKPVARYAWPERDIVMIFHLPDPFCLPTSAVTSLTCRQIMTKTCSGV